MKAELLLLLHLEKVRWEVIANESHSVKEMWKKFRNWDLVEIGIKGIVQANDENNENLEIKFMELCSPSMIIISLT